MNASYSITSVGSKCEAETANLLRSKGFAPARTATTIGAITLTHLAAQLLLAQFIMLKWIILFAVNACFFGTLPGDLTLSHSLAYRILAVLSQPVKSLPLPDWIGENWLTAFLLAAVNSAIGGVCLGMLAAQLNQQVECRRAVRSIGSIRNVAAPIRIG